MKIIFIGKFEKIWDEQGKAVSLEKLGHEVIRVEEPYLNSMSYNPKFDELIQQFIDIKPDVVIYTKLRINHPMRFINKMKQNGILTVSWFPDYCNVGR